MIISFFILMLVLNILLLTINFNIFSVIAIVAFSIGIILKFVELSGD